MSKKHPLKCVEEFVFEAIDNGYFFRGLKPCGGFSFMGPINDPAPCIYDEDTLYYKKNTAVSLMPELTPGLMVLDLDTEDEDKKEALWDLIKYEFGDNIYLRKGRPERIGQLIGQHESTTKFPKVKDLEIINQFNERKRCNVLGLYKDKDFYMTHPYKKFWEIQHGDLPYFSHIFIDKCQRIMGFDPNTVPSKKNVDKSEGQSRHNQNLYIAHRKVEELLPSLIKEMVEQEPYQDLVNTDARGSEEAVYKEMLDELKHAFVDKLNDYKVGKRVNHFAVINEKRPDDILMKFCPRTPPEVEPGSIIDIKYRAIRRNQRVDSKKIAFGAALSSTAWQLSLATSYEGLRPNLGILTVAPPSVGKSDVAKFIDEEIDLCNKLGDAFGLRDIPTYQGLLKDVQRNPMGLHFVDECSSMFRSMNNKMGNNANLAEKLSFFYSDCPTKGKPFAHELASSSYGVAYGVRLNYAFFTTPTIWEEIPKHAWKQGLLRRMLILIENMQDHKKFVQHSKSYFNSLEKTLLKTFYDKFVICGRSKFYDVREISKYKIVKEVKKTKDGEDVKLWSHCLAPHTAYELTSDEEVDKFLKDEFIEDLNKLKKYLNAYDSDYALYLAGSLPEFIRKFAAIYTLGGRSIFNPKTNELNFNTVVDMKAIKWAIGTYGYYFMSSLIDQLNQVYKKEKEINASVSLLDQFYKKLQEKETVSFKKSDDVCKNFFRLTGSSLDRNEALAKMIDMGYLRCDEDINSRKAMFYVEEK